MRGLGTVGNGRDVGLLLHPLLAVDAVDGTCLGLAHLHPWIRTAPAAPDYRKLPIEAKESYRWLQTAQAGKQCLSEAAQVTIIADRESDIYDDFHRAGFPHRRAKPARWESAQGEGEWARLPNGSYSTRRSTVVSSSLSGFPFSSIELKLWHSRCAIETPR